MQTKPKTKPVQLKLTPDAHRALKIGAAVRGWTMSTFVSLYAAEAARIISKEDTSDVRPV
jgi:uncharacterized protein (DUF1778 family)